MPRLWAKLARGGTAKLGLFATLGWLALVGGFIVDGQRAVHSYLAAYCWAVTLALGALTFLAIVHAMNATWPVAVRGVAELAAGTLPLFAVLFIPIFVVMPRLYPWMTPETFRDPRLHAMVMHRLAYYNVPFFVVRWAVAFAVWVGLALLFRRWSLQQRQADALALRRRMGRTGVASLIPLAVTFSVASFDWLMSLTPTWHSAVFGVYFFAGAFVSGLAVVTLAASWAQGRGLLPELRPSHFHAMGRLLLAFTAFWAYIAYFQFMLIWIANRPNEGSWFVQREAASWRQASIALVVGHFVVPFLLLLSHRLKRSRRMLGLLAAWLVAFHYLDMYWLVMPAHTASGALPSWIDAAAVLAVGCSALAFAVASMRGRPLLPVGDPLLAKALEYEAR